LDLGDVFWGDSQPDASIEKHLACAVKAALFVMTRYGLKENRVPVNSGFSHFHVPRESLASLIFQEMRET
jgi:hypothetical protein